MTQSCGLRSSDRETDFSSETYQSFCVTVKLLVPRQEPASMRHHENTVRTSAGYTKTTKIPYALQEFDRLGIDNTSGLGREIEER